jgi:hypothetical protein
MRTPGRQTASGIAWLVLALACSCGGSAPASTTTSSASSTTPTSEADRVWREDVTCWAPLQLELSCESPCSVGLPPDTRCRGLDDVRVLRTREIEARDRSLVCGCLCPDDPPPDIAECQ